MSEEMDMNELAKQINQKMDEYEAENKTLKERIKKLEEEKNKNEKTNPEEEPKAPTGAVCLGCGKNLTKAELEGSGCSKCGSQNYFRP